MNPLFFAPNFSPRQLPGLALWLDANDLSTITLSGSVVSQWADKSENGWNAVQATSGLQPTYNATALDGKPGIVFGGSSFLEASSVDVSQPWSIFAVAGFPTTDIYNFLFFTQGNSGLLLDYTTLNPAVFAGSHLEQSYSISGNHSFLGIANSTSSSLYIDGALGASGDAGPAPLYDAYIGSYVDGTNNWHQPISEIIVVAGVLSASEIGKIALYARTKWGTP